MKKRWKKLLAAVCAASMLMTLPGVSVYAAEMSEPEDIEICEEMPDETEEAVVEVLKHGINRLSETKEVLFETLRYLAVSRNGLRMQDLQKIFISRKKVLPTLDLTLLMKYADSFFCVHVYCCMKGYV